VGGGPAPPGAQGDTTATPCPEGTEDGGVDTVYGVSNVPKYNIRLCRVGGITVNVSIAANLKALLADASAAGITFGGGGFRTYQRQVELRTINNCADVYEASSSTCSPPTARPGESNHGSGEAIDFTQNGSTLSRSSSGYNWLKSNAGKYFLLNLPSEAWHWSVNGK
jgi:D-alanyl-D-alanine carboxypeptidase